MLSPFNPSLEVLHKSINFKSDKYGVYLEEVLKNISDERTQWKWINRLSIYKVSEDNDDELLISVPTGLVFLEGKNHDVLVISWNIHLNN